MTHIPAPRIRYLIASAVVMALAECAAASAQISITYSSFSTSVQDLSMFPGQDVVTFQGVQNPFHDSHTAQLGPGTATTAYDFSWSGDNANFRIDVSHADPDLGNTRYVTTSSGNSYFAPTVATRVALIGMLDYYLPVYGIDLRYSASIYDAQTFQSFFSFTRLVNTFSQPAPATGQILADKVGTLPVGRNYRIDYVIYLDTFGNTGAMATANGYMNLNFSPVPEPATLATLTLALAAARISSRRR